MVFLDRIVDGALLMKTNGQSYRAHGARRIDQSVLHSPRDGVGAEIDTSFVDPLLNAKAGITRARPRQSGQIGSNRVAYPTCHRDATAQGTRITENTNGQVGKSGETRWSNASQGSYIPSGLYLGPIDPICRFDKK